MQKALQFSRVDAKASRTPPTSPPRRLQETILSLFSLGASRYHPRSPNVKPGERQTITFDRRAVAQGHRPANVEATSRRTRCPGGSGGRYTMPPIRSRRTPISTSPSWFGSSSSSARLASAAMPTASKGQVRSRACPRHASLDVDAAIDATRSSPASRCRTTLDMHRER